VPAYSQARLLVGIGWTAWVHARPPISHGLHVCVRAFVAYLRVCAPCVIAGWRHRDPG
jgi:hypothetical protein